MTRYHRDGRAPGGGVYHLRDPRTDPRPGDWLAIGEVLIRVDHVALGKVFFALFRLDGEQPYAVTSADLYDFAAAVGGAGVVVIPDGDPRWTATVIDAEKEFC